MIFTLRYEQSEIREVLSAGARAYVLKSESDEEIIHALKALTRHQSYLSQQVSTKMFDHIFEHTRSNRAVRSLTTRERKVIQLIAEGNSNKNIAQLLSISVKTVETHRSASMRKLDIHSTAQLVRYAVRERIVQP